MLPKHVRYQTALHPVCFKPTQATKVILHKRGWLVKSFKRFLLLVFCKAQPRGYSFAKKQYSVKENARFSLLTRP